MSGETILVIDDDPSILAGISDLLGLEGYQPLTAVDASCALKIMKETTPDLILSDVMMPVMDGYAFHDVVKNTKDWAAIPFILVSAQGREQDVRRAVRSGVDLYITKPFNREQLLEAVESRLRRNEEILQSRPGSVLNEIIQTIGTIVEIRDPYTAGHQRRVSIISERIAKVLGLQEDEVEGIRLAALVHDVGKISIPADILNKPGEISPIEFELIKCHSRSGYDILKNIRFHQPVANIVLQHHERMNGSGYPDGIAGEEILIGARIIGVADVVESMTSHRPYRPALSLDDALQEIDGKKGVLYDPLVVEAFVQLIKEPDCIFFNG